MVGSFIMSGFKPDICEYLYIDNSEHNKYDAFAGVNKFLATARGDYIIVCHQDVLLHDHKIAHLDKIIEDITHVRVVPKYEAIRPSDFFQVLR